MALLFRRAFSTVRALQITMNSEKLPEIFHPPINKAMRELDRSFFQKTISVSAATLLEPKQTAAVRAALTRSQEMLQVTGIRPIVDDDTKPGAKCILMKPEVKADQPESWSSQLTQLVDDKTVQVRPYNLELTYENWTMHNILEAILPDLPEDQKETPSGFAQAGHIAHLNLRSQYLPYKKLIGQVLIDKNNNIRTVINKTLDVGSESEFRTFPYEILAGDNDLEVIASEQGCEFRFNFAEVYWNSRLGTEHERVVEKFKPGEAVCDVMAGVGPFAIPAGKKDVFVRANDLNPQSYQGLLWAIQRNKVSSFVAAECKDGRAFIQDATIQLQRNPRTHERIPNLKIPRNATPEVREKLAGQQRENTKLYHEPRTFDHFVLNLPASAVEFLPAFTGLYWGREDEFEPQTSRKLPMIHVYTFQTRMDTAEEEVQGVCEKVSKYLGSEVKPTDPDVEIFDARLVAPKKKYYCASFRLPAEVAFADVMMMQRNSKAQERRSRSSSRPRVEDLAL